MSGVIIPLDAGMLLAHAALMAQALGGHTPKPYLRRRVTYSQAITANALARLKMVKGEGTPPHAACVQRNGMAIISEAFEGGPMTKEYLLAPRESVLVTEPWRHFFAL